MALSSALLLGGLVGLEFTARNSARLAQNPDRTGQQALQPYRIALGDTLAISILNEPDLSYGSKRVEVRGNIWMPLAGALRVKDLTLPEAARAVENAYRDGGYLPHPDVSVRIESYGARVATVAGRVRHPGRIELPRQQRLPLQTVLQLAGGLDPLAAATQVKLARTQPDGSTRVYTLKLQADGRTRAAGSGDAEFPVEPDDAIYVPEKII